MIKYLILSGFVLMGSYSMAADKQENLSSAHKNNRINKIKKIVNEFYNKKLMSELSIGSFISDCRNEGSSCSEVACKNLGSFGCDTIDELREVNRACRGNYNGGCLKVMCKFAGTFGCDDLKEITPLAKACIGNYNGNCIKNTCDKLGTFSCDDIDELVEIGKYCSGAE